MSTEGGHREIQCPASPFFKNLEKIVSSQNPKNHLNLDKILRRYQKDGKLHIHLAGKLVKLFQERNRDSNSLKQNRDRV